MVTEPSNAVLAERIEKLSRDFYEYKKSNKVDMKEIETELEQTRRIADNVNSSISYVKTAVEKMEQMMSKFIDVQNQQNQKIDGFINSDSRRASKNNLVVSVLQVVGGILIAIIGFWAKGQF